MAAAKQLPRKDNKRLSGLGKDVRTCFVIMPFGKKKVANRRAPIDFDAVYRDIITPAMQSLRKRGIRIKWVRADDVEQAGLIHERMIESIADADVAIVDITSLNPNVFYELGVRHALRDRVTVLIRQADTQNPFNIGGMTTLTYGVGEAKVARAVETIGNFVANGLLSGNRDSLVYNMLPDLKVSRTPKPIEGSDVEEYRFKDAPGKRIGIVTGNLRHTNLSAKLQQRPIDIWVSSENINMQMARPYDESISGMIRYLGAEKDETSNIVVDVVANELRATMKKRCFVNPGEVVPTRSGRLEDSHNVKRILHAAAVYGVVGHGYKPITEVHQCITNALARMDWDAKLPAPHGARLEKTPADRPLTSVLFPLLGTGTGRGEIIQGARKQVGAALSYLRSRAHFTVIERVYFLAPTEPHRDGLRIAFRELQGKKLKDVPSAPPASAKPAAPPRRHKRSARGRK